MTRLESRLHFPWIIWCYLLDCTWTSKFKSTHSEFVASPISTCFHAYWRFAKIYYTSKAQNSLVQVCAISGYPDALIIKIMTRYGLNLVRYVKRFQLPFRCKWRVTKFEENNNKREFKYNAGGHWTFSSRTSIFCNDILWTSTIGNVSLKKEWRKTSATNIKELKLF